MSAFDTWIAMARAVPIEREIERRSIALRGRIDRSGPCPICGGEDRFSVNTAKGVFNCRGCGAKGDVIALVEALDHLDFIAAVEYLAGEPPPKLNGTAPQIKSRPPRASNPPREIIMAEFQYQDADGKLVFAVERIEYRDGDGNPVLTREGKHKKSFRQKRADGDGKWIFNVNGTPRLPYRLPELVRAVADHQPILLVEGEAKADLLISWAIPATCCAGGALKWQADHSEYLRGADVVILPDNDDPGRQHVHKAAASLRDVAASIRVLDLPDLPSKGDVIDWTKAGGTADKLRDLIATAKNYQPPQQGGPVIAADGIMSMQFKPIKSVVPGVIVEGLTLFAGKPKIGKSWLLLHAAMAVSDGGFTLGEIKCAEGDVLYCALEDNLRRLQSRLRKLLGTARKASPRLQFVCEVNRVSDGGLDFIAGWIKGANNPRLIIIDTLAMVRPPRKRDESNYDGDYSAVQALRTLAADHGVAIVLVHHLRKAEADDAFDTVSGTLGLTGAVDSVIILKRDSSSGAIVLHARGRDLIEVEKAMQFNRETCTWTMLGDASDARVSSERQAVLAALEEIGGPASVADVVAITGFKQANVRRMLERMARDGTLCRPERGRYALAAADATRRQQG